MVNASFEPRRDTDPGRQMLRYQANPTRGQAVLEPTDRDDGRSANAESLITLHQADLVRRLLVAVLGEREVVAVGILESQLHGTPWPLLDAPVRPSRFTDPFEHVLD